MRKKDVREVIIVFDASAPRILEKDIGIFLNMLSCDIKRFYSFNFSNLPSNVINKKDWEIINYLGDLIFGEENCRIVPDIKSKYFFITFDKDFIEDAAKGFIEHSDGKNIPADVELVDELNQIILKRSIYDAITENEFLCKVMVVVLYIEGSIEGTKGRNLKSKKRPRKIRDIFKKIKQIL